MRISEVLKHPEELIPLVRFMSKSQKAPRLARKSDAKWRFCFEYLLKVSRSFALVIMELEAEVRDAVCIFYLALRALDTIEDDTTADDEQRMEDCTNFYTHVDERGWSCSTYGKEHEKVLLEKYYIVVDCFLSLDEKYQKVIRDISKKMGAGMAEHIRDTECVTVADYNQYCYYVAGLVGLGLSNLFYETGREDISFVQREDLSISMGLFLQKINIIRDYLEDLHESRTFWPREIWSKYVTELARLKESKYEKQALACLNHMVTDALSHVGDCLEYMNRIQDPYVFRFCAIPQVMAIATLEQLYNNPMVFKGVVKLRRGTTAKLVLQTTDFSKLAQLVYRCSLQILQRMDPNDPNYELTQNRLQDIMNKCVPHIPTVPDLTILNRTAVVLFAGLVAYLIRRHSDADGIFVTWSGGVPDVKEMFAVAALFIVMTYLMSFFGLQFVRTDRQIAME